ncbi:c-type cytochrome [Azospirillum halopraeferens]|uniref:c-type cytochrome n=1 Tax=Azospirillum halopraeferens TaxID=34010 RepID=UPI0004120839|nr:cytochrome c [Azospirillum halopraeferens]
MEGDPMHRRPGKRRRPAAVPFLAAALAAALTAGTAPATTAAAAAELKPRTNYILRCTGCHGMDGAGLPAGGIPDFRDSVGAFTGDDEGRTYLLHVPGVIGAGLTDREIAAVLNFIMDTWAGRSLPDDFRPFTGGEVTERRARPVEDVVVLRRSIVARLRERGVETADYPWP